MVDDGADVDVAPWRNYGVTCSVLVSSRSSRRDPLRELQLKVNFNYATKHLMLSRA